MKGDFSRISFDAHHHFSRVLMQQGRVQVDADWNEQADIYLHALRSLAVDTIGNHGGPRDSAAFELSLDPDLPNDLLVSSGHYYVAGLLCEVEPHPQGPDSKVALSYLHQPSLPKPPALGTGMFLAFVDLSELHVTSLDHAFIREEALGGPDTTTRTQLIWQLKLLPVTPEAFEDGDRKTHLKAFEGFAKNLVDKPTGTDGGVTQAMRYRRARTAAEVVLADQARTDETGRMRARLAPSSTETSPCVIPVDSAYRGLSNQLYRVEIHAVDENGEATFKWSRDNGSRVAGWLGAGRAPNSVAVTSGRDFGAGQWVELTDSGLELGGRPGTLVKVASVEDDLLALDPRTPVPGSVAGRVAAKARRWDQRESAATGLADGAVPIEAETWIDLEDGIQVWFEPDGAYRTGDYWLVVARVTTSELNWPLVQNPDGTPAKDADGNRIPRDLPPHGVEHFYAPVAIVDAPPAGVAGIRDLRALFRPLTALG